MSFQIYGQHDENTGCANGNGKFINGVLNWNGDPTLTDAGVVIQNLGKNQLRVHVGSSWCGMGVNLDGVYKRTDD